MQRRKLWDPVQKPRHGTSPVEVVDFVDFNDLLDIVLHFNASPLSIASRRRTGERLKRTIQP